jgi:hypothetical protein
MATQDSAHAREEPCLAVIGLDLQWSSRYAPKSKGTTINGLNASVHEIDHV